MLDPKVFKAYDVRGIYPAELDEDGGYRIGRAFVDQLSCSRHQSSISPTNEETSFSPASRTSRGGA